MKRFKIILFLCVISVFFTSCNINSKKVIEKPQFETKEVNYVGRSNFKEYTIEIPEGWVVSDEGFIVAEGVDLSGKAPKNEDLLLQGVAITTYLVPLVGYNVTEVFNDFFNNDYKKYEELQIYRQSNESFPAINDFVYQEYTGKSGKIIQVKHSSKKDDGKIEKNVFYYLEDVPYYITAVVDAEKKNDILSEDVALWIANTMKPIK